MRRVLSCEFGGLDEALAQTHNGIEAWFATFQAMLFAGRRLVAATNRRNQF